MIKLINKVKMIEHGDLDGLLTANFWKILKFKQNVVMKRQDEESNAVLNYISLFQHKYR